MNGVSSFRHTTAGEKSTFMLTSRDVFHNMRTVGGDNLTVVVSSLGGRAPFTGRNSTALGGDACLSACAVDNNDGTYTVSVTPTISGQYQVCSLPHAPFRVVQAKSTA